MNTETVDLIATDPPFNKNKDFHATPDKLAAGAKFEDRWCWMNDVQLDWLKDIQDHHPEVERVVLTAKEVYSSGMGAFLCWLGVRLIEMRRVLKRTGTIYLHIDHTAHAYVKTLMDAIFGRENFRNEIVWCYTGPGNTPRHFKRKHDTILFYVNSGKAVFNAAAVRVPYSPATLARRRYTEGSAGALGITAGYAGGRTPGQVQEQFGGGKVPEDWWADIGGGGHIPAAERTGYPTQKPLALYERIIRASSSPGDMVLDPFCGCATTPVAAERLGRQWVGMDLWEGAFQVVQNRLAKENLVADTASGRDAAAFGGHLAFETITLRTEPFRRTDGGDRTPGFDTPLLTPTCKREPAPRMRKSELIEDLGPVCQGCARDYSFDPRVLEVHHREPRSDGGSDGIDNLTLLCPPCNRTKLDHMTLGHLQKTNQAEGCWVAENSAKVKHGKFGTRAPRNRRRRRR